MSSFGVPPEISALQSVQAQREAAKARDLTRAALERKRSTRLEEERSRVHDTAEIADVRALDEESSDDQDGSRGRRDGGTDGRQHQGRSGLDSDEGRIDVTA